MAEARNTPQTPTVTTHNSDFPDFRHTTSTCFAPGDLVTVDPTYVGQGGHGKVVRICDTLPYPIMVELSDTKLVVAVRIYEVKRLETPTEHSPNCLVTSSPIHDDSSDAGEG